MIGCNTHLLKHMKQAILVWSFRQNIFPGCYPEKTSKIGRAVDIVCPLCPLSLRSLCRPQQLVDARTHKPDPIKTGVISPEALLAVYLEPHTHHMSPLVARARGTQLLGSPVSVVSEHRSLHPATLHYILITLP